MRSISKWVAAFAAASVVAGGSQSVSAGLVGIPNMLGSAAKRMSLGSYVLPPMAYTQFCLRYADQCRPQRSTFRGGPARLTAERWEELKDVNRAINAAIIPQRNTEGLAGERWLVDPARGDCNDYAVSKRSRLLARGWPARALLLSEVKISGGEHHLVLVVRTSGGDVVLDNLSSQIRPWTRTPYRWLRLQTPGNPNYWAALGSQSV